MLALRAEVVVALTGDTLEEIPLPVVLVPPPVVIEEVGLPLTLGIDELLVPVDMTWMLLGIVTPSALVVVTPPPVLVVVALNPPPLTPPVPVPPTCELFPPPPIVRLELGLRVELGAEEVRL